MKKIVAAAALGMVDVMIIAFDLTYILIAVAIGIARRKR